MVAFMIIHTKIVGELPVCFSPFSLAHELFISRFTLCGLSSVTNFFHNIILQLTSTIIIILLPKLVCLSGSMWLEQLACWYRCMYAVIL